MILVAFVGLVIRLLFISYFSSGDHYYNGVFTNIVDVDYKVYLDASLYPSPYQRHTYRYSPILSYLMTPSYQYHQLFGKVLIAVCDMLTIMFIYKTFQSRGKLDEKINKKAAQIVSWFYALNPVLIYLTVRGSCQGITMVFASSFWYFYVGGDCHGNMSPVERIDRGVTERQPNILKRYVSYMLFGLWVHFRVYPIILVPLLIMHEYNSYKDDKLKKTIKFTLEFGLISGGVFLALAAYFYLLYGWDFIQETYLYHFTRRDNRHSKSVFFYEIYLNYKNDTLGRSASRIINRILPSALAILMVSFVYVRKRSLFFCYGLTMFYFVCFNRVITDQYYMWAFSSMYYVIPEIEAFKDKKWRQVITNVIKEHLVAPLPVILWLLMALKLERNVEGIYIFHVWLASMFILVIHTVIMTRYYCQIKPYTFENERKRNLQAAKKFLMGKKGKKD